MSEPFVDADVIVRLLAGDDLHKQERSAALFERVESGDIRLRTPVTTIADVVYVLSSPRLYAMPRGQVADLLKTLIRLPGFIVENRSAVLGALDLYASTRLESILYSYDRHFDKLASLTRMEP